MPWLDESEASEVHLVLQHLEYFDQNPVRRVRPLTLGTDLELRCGFGFRQNNVGSWT